MGNLTITKKKLFLGILCLAISSVGSIAYGKDNDVDINMGTAGGVVKDVFKGHSIKEKFFLTGRYRQSLSFWYPGWVENLLNYKTEGLHTFAGEGVLGYNLDPLITISYERPFHDTPTQRELLETNTTQSGGFDKLGIGVTGKIIKVLGEKAFGKVKGKSLRAVLAGVLSFKFRYTKERFFGEARADQPFVFLSRNGQATVNTAGGLVAQPGATQNIAVNEKVAFKTTFEDWEYTIDFVDGMKELVSKERKEELEKKGASGSLLERWGNPNLLTLRLGYYQSTWSRPASVSQIFRASDGAPVVFESDFKTRGVIMRFGHRNNDIPSPFPFPWITFDIRKGANDKIVNSVGGLSGGITNVFRAGENLEFFGFKVMSWYNFYPIDNLNLFFKPAVSFDWRSWTLREQFTVSPSLPVASDVILKVFGNVGMTF